MARPSTYDQTKDYDKLANSYLAICGREQTKLPKISEFCREYIGADEDTVKRWLNGEQLPEGANTEQLSGAIIRIKNAQKEELQDDGLFGGKECNVAMAIFLLKANHGMVETDRILHEGTLSETLNINITTYGKEDPLFNYLSSELRSRLNKPAIIKSDGGSSQVPSPELAQESKEDDTGDKSIN